MPPGTDYSRPLGDRLPAYKVRAQFRHRQLNQGRTGVDIIGEVSEDIAAAARDTASPAATAIPSISTACSPRAACQSPAGPMFQWSFQPGSKCIATAFSSARPRSIPGAPGRAGPGPVGFANRHGRLDVRLRPDAHGGCTASTCFWKRRRWASSHWTRATSQGRVRRQDLRHPGGDIGRGGEWITENLPCEHSGSRTACLNLDGTGRTGGRRCQPGPSRYPVIGSAPAAMAAAIDGCKGRATSSPGCNIRCRLLPPQSGDQTARGAAWRGRSTSIRRWWSMPSRTRHVRRAVRRRWPTPSSS